MKVTFSREFPTESLRVVIEISTSELRESPHFNGTFRRHASTVEILAAIAEHARWMKQRSSFERGQRMHEDFFRDYRRAEDDVERLQRLYEEWLKSSFNGSARTWDGTRGRAFYEPETDFRSTPGGWRHVLGFLHVAKPTVEDVKKKYRELAKMMHPDRGGTSEGMSALTAARDAALKELGT